VTVGAVRYVHKDSGGGISVHSALVALIGATLIIIGFVVVEIDQLGLSSVVGIYITNFLIALFATFARRSRVRSGESARRSDDAMTGAGVQDVVIGIPRFEQELQVLKVEEELGELREAASKKELEDCPKKQEDNAVWNAGANEGIEAGKKSPVHISEYQPDSRSHKARKARKERRSERRKNRRSWGSIAYDFTLMSIGSAVSLFAPHFIHLQ
jgi:hypothetical protein